MEIYKDKTLKEKIDNTLDLGRVKAGESKIFSYYIYNETGAIVEDIKFNIPNDEVEISSAPVMLNPRSGEKLILKWTPSITLKRGLKTLLKIKAAELWS